MRIVCLHCGRQFLIDQNAYESYEGYVRHSACGGVFWIKTRGGHLLTSRIENPTPRRLEFEEYFKNFQEVRINEENVHIRHGKGKPRVDRDRPRPDEEGFRTPIEEAERVFGLPLEDLPELEGGAEAGTSGDGVESEREQESERKAELGPGDPDGGGLQPIGHRSSESRKPQPLP
ncbi:MAG: hypothetical protein ACTSXC_04725 [Candidatus Freyarchaeota archaeon]